LAYSSSLSNTYTGGTVVSQGSMNLSGIAGTTVIPGDLTINGSSSGTTTVTMVGNAGQIAPAANIAINGSSSLTYVGNNSLNGTLAFTNEGGNAAPTLAVGTGILTLGNNITSSNNSLSFIPTISASAPGYVNVAAQRTITTSGLGSNQPRHHRSGPRNWWVAPSREPAACASPPRGMAIPAPPR